MVYCIFTIKSRVYGWSETDNTLSPQHICSYFLTSQDLFFFYTPVHIWLILYIWTVKSCLWYPLYPFYPLYSYIQSLLGQGVRFRESDILIIRLRCTESQQNHLQPIDPKRLITDLDYSHSVMSTDPLWIEKGSGGLPSIALGLVRLSLFVLNPTFDSQDLSGNLKLKA